MAEETKPSIAASTPINPAEEEPLTVKQDSKDVTIAEGDESRETETPKKVKLRTIDELIIEVEPSILQEMEILRPFVASSDIVPLPNVRSRELRRIIEFLSERRCKAKDDLRRFEDEFMAALSPEEVRELLKAGIYVDMKNFPFASIANVLIGKSVEFVRDFIGIVNDFAPEEEVLFIRKMLERLKGF